MLHTTIACQESSTDFPSILWKTIFGVDIHVEQLLFSQSVAISREHQHFFVTIASIRMKRSSGPEKKHIMDIWFLPLCSEIPRDCFLSTRRLLLHFRIKTSRGYAIKLLLSIIGFYSQRYEDWAMRRKEVSSQRTAKSIGCEKVRPVANEKHRQAYYYGSVVWYVV